ncbi:hypothetical protein [Fictibacillus sp. NRS-1165]|uniref:hypothetical protein n=1 Tax=Fictibacillus sp. NRS-1165 TaxID=3144463 RepID=UPI003D22EF29
MSENLYLPVRLETNRAEEKNKDETLELINRHTLEPFQSIDDLYVFSGVCSNDRLDSYHTKMDPMTTLRNYAEDLQSGVALLSGHDISKSPYGRSYDGEVLSLQRDEGGTAVRGHWYIMRNTMINGENTDDTIRAIKAGITRDMSVGFGGNDIWYRCSTCNRSLWDSGCNHFPGLEDENDERTFAWIVDAHLREVSTVYKGATPGAQTMPSAYIEKARMYVDQGELSHKKIQRLESAYQVRLDDGKRSFYMPPKQETKEGNVSMKELLDNLRQAIRENKMEKGRIYDILTEEGEPFRQPDDISLRNELGREYTRTEAIRQLKKEAQQGRRYLADMIDDAVSARVRAQGSTFNVDSYRQMLRDSSDIDVIKEEIDAYQRLAKERFVPGRQTEPEKPEPRNEEPEEVRDPVKIDLNENFFEEGVK